MAAHQVMPAHQGKRCDDGRWGGKLTRRPLLDGDDTVDALDDVARREISAVWLARSASERRVGDAFSVIRDALVELGRDARLVEIAERAVDDELRHEEICRVMASRYAGTQLDLPPRLELCVPRHPGAGDELELELWIIGHCCMNETIASSFLEAAVATTTGPMARTALKELLSDEIDHARIGWAFLASLPASHHRAIAPWLPGMLRGNLKMWREAPRSYPKTDELASQGAPLEATVEAALLTAIRELVLPGFARFAIPTEAMESWLASGARTS